MQLLFHFIARLRAIVRPETAIDPQASAAHPRHLSGQKLRLGGDALGADPTYLLYLAYRSRGELRRIDFEPDRAGATLSDFAAPKSPSQASIWSPSLWLVLWRRGQRGEEGEGTGQGAEKAARGCRVQPRSARKGMAKGMT